VPTKRRPARRPSDGPTKASIYVRISLDKTGEGLGVERQEMACRELCAARGWEVQEVFSDNDISATSGRRRPGFEALLASDPEVIVVWHTDRLVRLSSDLERVIDLECNVHGVTAGHVDLSNPAGRAVAKTITAWAQYEGEQKALRQRAAGRQRASRGKSWWGSRPFGFEMDGTLRESEASALRQAYTGLLAGTPVARLAKALNDAGHVTTFGRPWGPASLRPVLLNARNAGIRVYDGEEIGQGKWEAIVPEETWRAAVRLLKDPARYKGGKGPTPRNLLTGIATCGKCGGPIKANVRYPLGDREPYRIYACRTNHCVSIPVDWTDDFVWFHVLQALPDPAFQAAWTLPVGDDEGSGDVAALKQAESTLRQRLAHAADDYADGNLTREQLARITERTRTRLEEVESQVAAMGGAYDLSSLLGDIEYVADAVGRMTTEEQRALIGAVVRTIQLMPRARGSRVPRPEDVSVTLRSAADIRSGALAPANPPRS
jgi:site-specific DNA recombinase